MLNEYERELQLFNNGLQRFQGFREGAGSINLKTVCKAKKKTEEKSILFLNLFGLPLRR